VVRREGAVAVLEDGWRRLLIDVRDVEGVQRYARRLGCLWLRPEECTGGEIKRPPRDPRCSSNWA
jgi:hypothetical protein